MLLKESSKFQKHFQILSTIIKNISPKNKGINLKSTVKITSRMWENTEPREMLAGGTQLRDNEMTETEVIIRGGDIVAGVFDKTHFGATPQGLIHCMYEVGVSMFIFKLETCVHFDIDFNSYTAVRYRVNCFHRSRNCSLSSCNGKVSRWAYTIYWWHQRRTRKGRNIWRKSKR